MNGLESLYQELIIDHSKRPIGRGDFHCPNGCACGSHHEYNPSCGDEITVNVAVNSDSGKIEQIAWEGEGCSISTASASLLCQLIREDGWTVGEAQERIELFRRLLRSKGEGLEGANLDMLGDAIALQGVGKFVMRVKCAMLAWVALEAALMQTQ